MSNSLAVRINAIHALVNQYTEVLATLQEIAGSKSTVSTKARGLHRLLSKAVTLLGLQMALAVLGPLKC